MKDAIVFILSELFMYAFILGVVIIASPTIPIVPAFVITSIIYVFSTTMYFITEFIIKLVVNNRGDLDK